MGTVKFNLICAHLSLQAIAIFIKDKIHALVGATGFFIIATIFLLGVCCGGTNRHDLRFTKAGFRICH